MCLFQNHRRCGYPGQLEDQGPEGQGPGHRQCEQGHVHDLQEGDPGHDPGKTGQNSRQGTFCPRRPLPASL